MRQALFLGARGYIRKSFTQTRCKNMSCPCCEVNHENQGRRFAWNLIRGLLRAAKRLRTTVEVGLQVP